MGFSITWGKREWHLNTGLGRSAPARLCKEWEDVKNLGTMRRNACGKATMTHFASLPALTVRVLNLASWGTWMNVTGIASIFGPSCPSTIKAVKSSLQCAGKSAGTSPSRGIIWKAGCEHRMYLIMGLEELHLTLVCSDKIERNFKGSEEGGMGQIQGYHRSGRWEMQGDTNADKPNVSLYPLKLPASDHS